MNHMKELYGKRVSWWSSLSVDRADDRIWVEGTPLHRKHLETPVQFEVSEAVKSLLSSPAVSCVCQKHFPWLSLNRPE